MLLVAKTLNAIGEFRTVLFHWQKMDGVISDHVGGLLRMSRVSGRGQRDISTDSGNVHIIPDGLSRRHEKLSVIVWTPIRCATLHFRDRRGAASLRYRNHAKIPFLLSEQKPLSGLPVIWYGFRAGACAKATQYGVNITSVTYIYHGGFRLHHDCSRLH